MKVNPDEMTVRQTVQLGDLPSLPPVTIRRCAVEVDLDQIHDGQLGTVSLEFDTLQRAIDILTRICHDRDLVDWSSPTAIVVQTVRLGNLSPLLPTVMIQRGAVGVDLKQFHSDKLNTVSIEFDSLQKVIDTLNKMLHDQDLEDWNSMARGAEKPGTGTPSPHLQ
jgi:hypothetical protein